MTEAESPVVERFHEILIWPLELVLPESMKTWTENPDFAQRLARHLAAMPWQMQDVLKRGTADNEDLEYSEFVYFHPFVQRVLYPGANEKNPALAILSRRDIHAVEVTLGGETRPLTFDVKRVHLYLFRSQSALLVVEVQNREPMALPTVQNFADQFRRAYSPYHRNGKGGHCPEKVKWLVKPGQPAAPLEESNYFPADMHAPVLACTSKKRAPIAAHWRSLFSPLKGAGDAAPNDIGVEQLEDDRIPTMVYLGIADPFQVTRGDFMRICFSDEKGYSGDLPYAPAFLTNFEKHFCYDRFWNPPEPSGPGSQYSRRKLEWRNTRYLCAGYNFAVVTTPTGYGEYILNSFRHHYFQIGLLAHFHRASMLKYSRRLTDEVAFAEATGEKHWDAVIRVRREFADFINQYWFQEISNQEQAKELFQWWSDRLGNHRLFEQLRTESEAVDRILSQEHEKNQRKELNKLQLNTERLTKAIYWLAGLTLIVAFLDSEMMRTFAQRNGSFLLSKWPDLQAWWPLAWNVVWCAVLTTLLFLVYFKWLFRKEPDADQGRSS